MLVSKPFHLVSGNSTRGTRPFFRKPGSSEGHAAGNFDPRTVSPAILVGKKRSDHGADVIRRADAPL